MFVNAKKIMQAALVICAMTGLFLFTSSVSAAPNPINKSLFGVALEGYDAVAYFKESRAVKGKTEFRYDWMGAKWYFASAANRDEFAKNPQNFAPQFGGYCAYAVAQGRTAGIDPEAWRIVNGKLYLNYSKGIQKKWEEDVPGNIKKGETNWPGIIKK